MGRWLALAEEAEKKLKTSPDDTHKTYETPENEVLSVLSVRDGDKSEIISPAATTSPALAEAVAKTPADDLWPPPAPPVEVVSHEDARADVERLLDQMAERNAAARDWHLRPPEGWPHSITMRNALTGETTKIRLRRKD